MTTAAEIAKHLKKAKRAGDGSWVACCPAHNDKNPSLSITDVEGRDTPLLHCHAGCEFTEIVNNIPQWPRSNTEHEWEQITAFGPDYINPRRYIYKDENDLPVYMVERTFNGTGKTFKQYTIKDGTIKRGIEGVPRLPYRLPEIQKHSVIYICEGEQAVDAMWLYGYPATCNSSGANNWKEEINPYFKDKTVIIIPDNDIPGRKHALKVAEHLHDTAKTIIIADICRHLKDKADMVDWFQHNSSKIFKVHNIVSQIKPWQPGDTIEEIDPDAFPIENYTAMAWLDKIMEPRDYLMGTLLCTTSRWMVYAPTGLGKTLFTMNMMAAMAAGKQFLNWQPGRKCRVLYIDGEMPAETFKERIVQVTQLYGQDIELIGINRDDEASQNNEMPPLNTENGVAWLKHKVKYIKPDAIAFDSIMCLLGGDMKDEESWEPIKETMKWLTNQRIAQVWIHHTGHAEGRSYGSNTREWELDTVLRLDRPQGDEDGFVLNFTKNRLRTHANANEFDRIHCQLGLEGWTFSQNVKEPTKKGDDRSNFAAYIMQAYDNLAHNASSDHRGYDGKSVTAIDIDAIRKWIVRHGLIPPKTDGSDIMSDTDRKVIGRAQADLIKAGRIAANEGRIWRVNTNIMSGTDSGTDARQ